MTEHTIHESVISLDQLRGRDGEYLTGTVHVTKHVDLRNENLERLPVRFGTVGGYFNFGGNRLTSLEGAPSTVNNIFYCFNNQLTSLQGAHRILRRIDGTLYLWSNPIESGGIGLLLVEGLTRIQIGHPAFDIINRYLGQGMTGMLRCQEALHDAGYGEFAKL